MRSLFLFLLCATLTAQELDVTSNPRTSPADAAAGAKTFRSHCAVCHGSNGEGGRGPSLAAGRFYHGSSDSDLLQNIANGIPGTDMPGLFYSPDRIWQVIAYVRSLAGSSGSVSGDAARGGAVFRSKGCFRCHRVNGEGGRQGPDLTLIGQSRSPEYLRRSIVDPNADVPQRYWVVRGIDGSGTHHEGFLMNEDTYTVEFIDFDGGLHTLMKSGLKDYRVDRVSKMPSFQSALSPSELDDIVAYLSSLRPKGGSQ